jgi:hypothetical protein
MERGANHETMSQQRPLLIQAIAFFEVTDGRDKLAKMFNNLCRALAWHCRANGALAARFMVVSAVLSEFRAIIKFCKWLKNFRDIKALTWNDDTLGDTLELGANMGDIGYRGFDNIKSLAKWTVIPGGNSRADRADGLSDIFQFWGYLVQFISTTYQRTRVIKDKAESDEKYAKRLGALNDDLIMDAADFLRVLPPMGYLPFLMKSSWKAQPAFSGWMGVIVGFLGSRKVWRKC